MISNGIDQIVKGVMPTPAIKPRSSGDPSFADYLSEARLTFGHDKVNNQEDVIREGAKELVATAFLKPIFKMMREDPLRSDVLPISKGEKLFGPLLDAKMAEQITDRSHYSLVDAVVRSLTHGTKTKPQHSSEISDGVSNKKSISK